MRERGVESIVENRALTADEVGLLAGLIVDEPDHYTALGVDRNASNDDIRSAYRLAVEYFHPLKNRVPETEDVIQRDLSSAWGRLEKAFSILSSYDRRKIYDDHLSGRDSKLASHIETSAGIEPDRSRPPQRQEGNASSSAERKKSAPAASGNEKRRAERLALCLPLCVTFENSWREFTHTLDVSPLAIRFYSSRRIKPRSRLRVELPMPKQLRTHNHDDEFYMANAFVIYVIQDNCGRQIVAEFV